MKTDADIDEQFERARPSLHTVRRILRFVRPYWRQMIAPLAIVVFGVVARALVPHLVKIAIDSYILPGSKGEITLRAALVGVGFLVSLMVLNELLQTGLSAVQRANCTLPQPTELFGISGSPDPSLRITAIPSHSSGLMKPTLLSSADQLGHIILLPDEYISTFSPVPLLKL